MTGSLSSPSSPVFHFGSAFHFGVPCVLNSEKRPGPLAEVGRRFACFVCVFMNHMSVASAPRSVSVSMYRFRSLGSQSRRLHEIGSVLRVFVGKGSKVLLRDDFRFEGPELPRQPLFGGEALEGDVLEWKAGKWHLE